MQKLVIDTNVLVSAVMGQSYPNFIMRAIFLDKNVALCISDEVFTEYQDVLTRSKFSKYPGFILNAEKLLISIDTFAQKFIPEIKLDVIKDKDDNKFLELAVTCNANFLITGNTKDFIMESFGQTKIITPKDFWELYH